MPLAYWWDTYDRYVLPKLLLARVLVIGLLILFVTRAFLTASLTIKRTPLDLPLLAFVASAFLSTLVAENQNVAVFGIYSRYDGLLTILMRAALFWLSVQAISGPGGARTLLRVLLASGYLVGLIAILKSVNIEGLAEIDGVVHVLARDPNAAWAGLRAGGYSIECELAECLIGSQSAQH